jgi:hypothetical protein
MPEDLTRIAQMDQAIEGLRTPSQLMWEYLMALRAAGFSEKQAFILVRDWHKALRTGAEGNSKKK